MAEYVGPLLGTGGGLGILAVVIIYLLGSNRSDRGQALERIKQANQRADAALKREAELQERLDQVLRDRRAAEDREAKLALQVGQLREEVASLRAEIARLRDVVGTVP